jgi:hypothetical protein
MDANARLHERENSYPDPSRIFVNHLMLMAGVAASGDKPNNDFTDVASLQDNFNATLQARI